MRWHEDDFRITVAIPAHLARAENGMLLRATNSAYMQTLQPAAVSVAMDMDREGAPVTRQRALDAVLTPWVAFLDSDDWFEPEHLQQLAGCALLNDADYVYSYWHGPDVLGNFGRPFDPAKPVETTSTILVRTDLAKKIGFQALPERQANTGEDWRFTTKAVELGAKIVHLAQRTWHWEIHGMNTSGLPTKGDAAV